MESSLVMDYLLLHKSVWLYNDITENELTKVILITCLAVGVLRNTIT